MARVALLLACCACVATASLTLCPSSSSQPSTLLQGLPVVTRLRGGGILRIVRNLAGRVSDELTLLPEEEILSKATNALRSAETALAEAKNQTALSKAALKSAGLELGAASKVPPKATDFDAWLEKAKACQRQLEKLDLKVHTTRSHVEMMAQEAIYLREKGDDAGAKSMTHEMDALVVVLRKHEAAFAAERATAAEIKKQLDRTGKIKKELDRASEGTAEHSPSKLAWADGQVEKGKAALASARKRERDAAAAVASAKDEVMAKRPAATAARKLFREEQKRARAAR